MVDFPSTECYIIFVEKMFFIIWRNTQVRLKGSVLKTDRRVKPRGGSNPSSSAIFYMYTALAAVFSFCKWIYFDESAASKSY